MRIAGVNFDHFHMGDLLRHVVNEPRAELVGVADADVSRMQQAISSLRIKPEMVFTNYQQCLEMTRPDLVILCPSTGEHADWVEKVAPFGAHILMEKPFASSLTDADRMVEAMKATGKTLAINWPLVWVPAHRTAKRLIDQGFIGDVIEVHFYDGNRGPLYHLADKVEVSDEEVLQKKPTSWFYSKAGGGGSMLDYLGYGTTLGTWFHGGKKPIEVTAVVDSTPGIEVDEHSITIARYDCGLTKFETRWGTFTDPWINQPQPKCGFVLRGTEGTISSYDYEPTIRVQTRSRTEAYDIPVDEIAPPYQNPVQYMIHCLSSGQKIEGPLSTEISRIGQQIVDSALLSAACKRTIPLLH